MDEKVSIEIKTYMYVGHFNPLNHLAHMVTQRKIYCVIKHLQKDTCKENLTDI